jgi:hypothetical protein
VVFSKRRVLNTHHEGGYFAVGIITALRIAVLLHGRQRGSEDIRPGHTEQVTASLVKDCRTLSEAVGSTCGLAAAHSVADVGLSFTWESCYTIRFVKYSLMIVNGTKGPMQVFSAACLAGRQ